MTPGRSEVQGGSAPLSVYAAAGVDTREADSALRPMVDRLSRTLLHRGHALLPFGHFANVVRLGSLGIAVSTDNVGTKVLIAQLMDKYDTIGIDCVAVNVNDILCVGAEPQTMVDYIAVEHVAARVVDQIAKGLEEGARLANITIVGGELAQVPEIVRGEGPGTGLDLSGTCIGTVDPDAIMTGRAVRPGDLIVGLRSSGVHSNGLSLARTVFGITSESPRAERIRTLAEYNDELGETLGEALLRPTRIYVSEVLQMIKDGVDVRGLAHITGDGFLNLPRLNADVGYVIDSLPEPQAVFGLIQRTGSVSDSEMFEVFNMGIGFCVIVPASDESAALATAEGCGAEAFTIGHVTEDSDRTVDVAAPRLRGWRHKGFHSVAGQ